MIYSLAKALSEYPVFLLVIASLLTIALISTHIMNQMYIHYHEVLSNSREIASDAFKYSQLNGSLYISCINNYDYIIELIFQNRSYSVVKLNPINRSLYGPIIIPDNFSYIALLGVSNGKSRLIDILVRIEPVNKIFFDIERALPPSIALLASGSVNYIESINGAYSYYELEPVIMKRIITLFTGKTYNVTYDEIIENNNVFHPIIIDNEYVDPRLLDEILKNVTISYGNITQIRYYIQRIYLNNTYAYSSSSNSIYTYSYTPQITLYSSVKIADILVSEPYSLVNISLEHIINNILIVDLSGTQYSGALNIIYYVIISNSTWSEKYFAGSYSGYTNVQNQQIDINYKIHINSTGRYSISLLTKYTIRIPPIFAPPVYVTIVYSLSGNYQDNIAVSTYLTDKLFVETSDGGLVILPFENNTLTKISIDSCIDSYNYTLTINNSTTITTSSFSVMYLTHIDTKVLTTIIAHPSIIVNSISSIIITSDENMVSYVINETGLYRIMGIYTNKTMIKIKATYLPAIKIGNEFLSNITSNIYVCMNNTNAILYINNTATVLNLTSKYNLYGFIVLNKAVYEKPMLLVDYKLMSSIIRSVIINVSFVDNTSLLLCTADPYSAFIISNKPVRSINIYMFLHNISTVAIYSIGEHNFIGLVDENGTINEIVHIYKLEFSGDEYYLIKTSETEIIVDNKR